MKLKITSYEWFKVICLMLIYIVILILLRSVAQGQSQDEVELTIREIAGEYGVDEDLAVAIAQVESGLNPHVVGSLGELGVFQLRPEYHEVKPGETVQNTETAIKYLVKLQKDCAAYGEAWVVCYNLGPHYKRLKYPKLFPYFTRVMDAKRKLAGR